MSDTKALAIDVMAKYEVVLPTLRELNVRLREIKKNFENFRRDNSYWNSKYNWLGDFNSGIGVEEIDIDSELFAFEWTDYNGGWESASLTFDEFDNFEAFLAAEYEVATAVAEVDAEALRLKTIATLRATKEKAEAELARLVLDGE